MLIVDSQVHLSSREGRSWEAIPAGGFTPEERARRPLHHYPDVDDLLRETAAAGVDAVVLVPSASEGSRPDNDACLAAARNHPTKFAVMGRVVPDRPTEVARLDEWRATHEVLGVRVSFNVRRGNTSQLSGDATEWLWDALASRQMPVMVFAPGMTGAIGEIALRHPSLRIVVDHLGIDVDELHDDLRPTLRPLLELARLPNVAVKASALPAVVSEAYPFPVLAATLREVIDVFTPDRVFWGSDLSRLPCRYGELVEFFLSQLDFLSSDERAAVLGSGIVRWLDWTALRERT